MTGATRLTGTQEMNNAIVGANSNGVALARQNRKTECATPYIRSKSGNGGVIGLETIPLILTNPSQFGRGWYQLRWGLLRETWADCSFHVFTCKAR